MNITNLFYSFRVRLLLVLAALLIATLGVQYVLNRQAEQRGARLIAEQEQALAAGISLAVENLSSTERLGAFDRERKSFLLETQAGRVTNVLIVNDKGRVEGQLDDEDLIDDSLDLDYVPQSLDNDTVKYFKVSEAHLPRLVNASQPTDIKTTQPVAGEPRAFVKIGRAHV